MELYSKKELVSKVDNREVYAIIDNKGIKYRLFVNDGMLCYMKKGSSKYGYRLHSDIVDDVVKYIPFKNFKETPKSEYRPIFKFKKLASSASFNNSFIRSCNELPDFDTWMNDLIIDQFDKTQTPKRKSLYNLHVASGSSCDGKVISIDRISKQYPNIARDLRDAIVNKRSKQICSRVQFGGYEMTISTHLSENGDFHCHLSLEYKDCCNGHYYLLINDNTFIGYETD